MIIDTGYSDFCKMCIVAMKMHYSQQKNIIIYYYKFQDFDSDTFIDDLNTLVSKLFNKETIPFEALRELMNLILQKLVQLIRHLSMEIMIWS